MRKLLFVSIIVFGFFFTFHVWAVEGCKNKTLTDINEIVEDCKNALNENLGQQKTLSSTIQYLENKTRLTEGEMRKTELEIQRLEKEIEMLQIRIGGLELSLKRLTEILISRVQNAYKKRMNDPTLLLFSSQSFGDFFMKYKYMQLSQNYTRTMINEAEIQKISYDEEKTVKEKKQREVEQLRKKLETQKILLQQQKIQKQALLTSTKNDESRFQTLLQQAIAEKNAIEAALVSGKKVGPIKRGDPIALVGNTGYPGCSTGEHLHFEIRKDNTWVDPENYLSSKTVKDGERGGNTTLGRGSWDWPLQDPVLLTQHYGHTPYSWRYKYSGGIHTGFDMISNSSKVIRAPADGTLFSSSQGCGGSTINIKYIEHENNIISLYLHVQ
ncbi:MAG: peptidoglycan DD-metalloendopeptidase family protein [Candidatus Pacebacteria bacterium]|nr:peptidoglycan DD-metalloendopeptidase family protein [Candidatus Paceibacterota bacterium]